VQPEFEGVVGKVFIHEGESVKRGQVLAEMDAGICGRPWLPRKRSTVRVAADESCARNKRWW